MSVGPAAQGIVVGGRSPSLVCPPPSQSHLSILFRVHGVGMGLDSIDTQNTHKTKMQTGSTGWQTNSNAMVVASQGPQRSSIMQGATDQERMLETESRRRSWRSAKGKAGTGGGGSPHPPLLAAGTSIPQASVQLGGGTNGIFLTGCWQGVCGCFPVVVYFM